jgi:hypothetical protein
VLYLRDLLDYDPGERFQTSFDGHAKCTEIGR